MKKLFSIFLSIVATIRVKESAIKAYRSSLRGFIRSNPVQNSFYATYRVVYFATFSIIAGLLRCQRLLATTIQMSFSLKSLGRASIIVVMSILNVKATTIGSDTAPSRFSAQQTLNTGDRVAGFAALDGGLALASSMTTATFDSFFPVSGAFTLNGGTLILNQDLYLESPTLVQSYGVLDGHNHKFTFSPLPVYPFPAANLSCALNFATSATPILNPNTNLLSVDWSFDSQFVVTSADRLTTGTSVYIYNFNGAALTFKAATGLGLVNAVNTVRWHPSEYVFAAAQNAGGAATSQLFTYSFVSGTNTITSLSAINISENAESISWHPSGNFLAVGTGDVGPVNSSVNIYSVDTSGHISALLTSTLTQNNSVVQPEALDWDATGVFIAAGVMTGGTTRELEIFKFTPPTPGPVALTADSSVLFNSTINAAVWNPTISNLLAVGLQTSGANQFVQLYQHSTGSLVQIPSGTITGIGKAVTALDWTPDGSCLMVGTINAAGSTNTLSYAFDPSAKAFTLISQFLHVTDGPVQSVSVSPNGSFFATVDQHNVLSAYDTASGILTSTCSTLKNLNVVFNGDLFLENVCIKLSGNTQVSGQGNVVTIGEGASVVIDTGANILFENITIRGIDTGSFFCLDNSSTMSFQNTFLVLDDNLTFSLGRIDVINNTDISGAGYTLLYTATQQATIWGNAQLTLDSNLTFSYAPSDNARTHLQFFDGTSVLYLNNTTLAAIAGISLLRGRVLVDGNTSLFNQGNMPATSFALGDGLNATNNCIIRGLPAANMFIKNGYFQYNNV